MSSLEGNRYLCAKCQFICNMIASTLAGSTPLSAKEVKVMTTIQMIAKVKRPAHNKNKSDQH